MGMTWKLRLCELPTFLPSIKALDMAKVFPSPATEHHKNQWNGKQQRPQTLGVGKVGEVGTGAMKSPYFQLGLSWSLGGGSEHWRQYLLKNNIVFLL